jgi:branched-chain amino acid transport system ATP-binding protein
MSAPVLSLRQVSKRFGGLVVTDDVTLDIMPGELHAVIGPNGAGKTTLINQISGQIESDSGRILLDEHDITALPPHARANLGIARTYQITSVIPSFTVLQNVALAAQAKDGSSFRFFGRVDDEAALNAKARAALGDLGLADRAQRLAGELSHGEKRVLELAMALVIEPKLLLLDEPMAGTGRDETAQLTSVLRSLKGRFPILLVEHDMSVVFALADTVSVLCFGRVLASGAPAAVRADPRVVSAYLGEEVL